MDIFDLADEEAVTPQPPQEPAFLADLNPEQKLAVLTTEGPLLVLSGAGTGKTKVLTTRIAYLIQQRLARPWQILAVTFTNKASKEMKERLERMIGGDAFSVWLGTFHAIGVRILRKYPEMAGLQPNFIVLNSDDQERALKQIMQDAGMDIKKHLPSVMLEIIQRWKDKGLAPEAVTAAHNSNYCDGRALEFYFAYQRRLRVLNAVDFGDLLLLPLLMFQNHPELLAQYQQQFRYILVDEYQDTNIAQYLLLRLLAKGHGNICCVGDDDQSIYSWRGAEVENILGFQSVFPNAIVVRLERNYRSTGHILGAASGLIAHNSGRLGKTLKVADTSGNMGEKVAIHGYWNGDQEAEKIISEIEEEQRRGTPLSQMAILVRASFQTRAFEESLMRYGIPYKIIGGFKFYEREEIKDAVAYLRLVLNPNDDLAFMRIVNKPRRGIGDQAMAALNTAAKEKRVSLFDAIAWATLRPTVRKSLDGLVTQLKSWREAAQTLDPDILAKQVLEESGYLNMLRTDKSSDAAGRIENLGELYNVLDDFKTIDEFIEYASLVTDTDDQSNGEQVLVMTLHASKGLEFKHVYLPGWEEGLFPHQKALDESGDLGLEEERRLAYVGITRARQKAFISFASNRRVYGQWQNAIPSRFVEELPDEHIVEINPQSRGRQIDFDDIRTEWQSFGRHAQKESYEPTVFDRGSHFGTQNFNRMSEPQYPKSQGLHSTAKPFFKTGAPVKKSGRVGKRVYHEDFGYGTVVRDEGQKVEVKFDHEFGTRKVMARFLNPA